MSRFTLTMLFSLLSVLGINAADKLVEHVQPLCWWTGMRNTELQIMLHGKGLGAYDVELRNAENVVLNSVCKFPNKNYTILYVDINNAQAQTFTIALVNGKKTVATIPYELKNRENRRLGSFDSSDVLYLLMPDRFACGEDKASKDKMYKGMREDTWNRSVDMARHGGDLAGMTQRLDYLSELGITAIWPTPLLENNMDEQSYHGYAITDYYSIDQRYGSNDDYRDFVAQSHAKGIKIIKDIVFNHCGSRNFLFEDRPADDWFNFRSRFTQTTYKTGAVNDIHSSQADRTLATDGWFVKTMPDFNQRNKFVCDYLIQASIWWVEYAGVDGFRQDTYPYNDFDFMRRWCEALECQYPGFNVVGETWINNNVGVSYWQKDSKLAYPKNSQLKTVMDFPLMSLLTSVVDEETNDWDMGMARLYEYLSQDIIYADPNHLLTFLANHDTDRFQPDKDKAQNLNRYMQALTLLLTLRGTPQLYYGDEIGMYANKSVNDGALRQDFPGGWSEDANNAFTNSGRTELQRKYFDFTKRLLNWRKGNAAVAYGNLTHFAVHDGVYVYSRYYEGQTVTVMINGTDKGTEVRCSTYDEVLPAREASDVISGKNVRLDGNLRLSPRQVMVLEFAK